jgi:hypothetical protein
VVGAKTLLAKAVGAKTFLAKAQRRKGGWGKNLSRKGAKVVGAKALLARWFGQKRCSQRREYAKVIWAFDRAKLTQMPTHMNHWPKNQTPNKCKIYWEFE